MILFITFETDKRCEIWIFETNEFKILTLISFLQNKKQFLNIFSNIKGGGSQEAS